MHDDLAQLREKFNDDMKAFGGSKKGASTPSVTSASAAEPSENVPARPKRPSMQPQGSRPTMSSRASSMTPASPNASPARRRMTDAEKSKLDKLIRGEDAGVMATSGVSPSQKKAAMMTKTEGGEATPLAQVKKSAVPPSLSPRAKEGAPAAISRPSIPRTAQTPSTQPQRPGVRPTQAPRISEKSTQMAPAVATPMQPMVAARPAMPVVAKPKPTLEANVPSSQLPKKPSVASSMKTPSLGVPPKTTPSPTPSVASVPQPSARVGVPPIPGKASFGATPAAPTSMAKKSSEKTFVERLKPFEMQRQAPGKANAGVVAGLPGKRPPLGGPSVPVTAPGAEIPVSNGGASHRTAYLVGGILAVILLVAVGAGVYYFVFRESGELAEEVAVESESTATPFPTTTALATLIPSVSASPIAVVTKTPDVVTSSPTPTITPVQMVTSTPTVTPVPSATVIAQVSATLSPTKTSSPTVSPTTTTATVSATSASAQEKQVIAKTGYSPLLPMAWILLALVLAGLGYFILKSRRAVRVAVDE